MRRLLTLLALLSAPALAHDLWVDHAGERYTLLDGHLDSDHEGVKRIEYPPEHVTEAACFDAAGERIPAELSRTYPVALTGACAVSWFLTSSGYWSKTPHGVKNLPKTEAGAVMDSWRSVESVKRVDAWREALAKPLTPALEIVPVVDPLGLEVGDELRLAVYRQGQLVAGVQVAYFDQPRGVTGRDGRINVRIRATGIQLIQASLETPLEDGKADRLIETATLQIEAGP
jgi:nickel transport protein